MKEPAEEFVFPQAREAPERQRLISSGQTHHLGEKKKCKKKLPLFLEKPRLKILGKIRYHFQPLRPQSHSYLCFLSPPPPRCHWLSAPEFKHTQVSPLGGGGGRKKGQNEAGPLSPPEPSPAAALSPTHTSPANSVRTSPLVWGPVHSLWPPGFHHPHHTKPPLPQSRC